MDEQQEAIASEASVQGRRNFVIPGCSVIIACEEEEGLPVQDLLSIVFNLVHSNPDAKVDFWIKTLSGGNSPAEQPNG